MKAALLTSRTTASVLDPAAWLAAGWGPVAYLEEESALPTTPCDLWVVDWANEVPPRAWDRLLAFHREGGQLLIVGPRPFTPEGSVKYLRALGWIDGWEWAEPTEGARLVVENQSWDFAVANPPPPVGCGSGLWHLSPLPDPRGLMFDSSTVQAARISFPVRYLDPVGRTSTAPAVRLDPFEAGPILWLPFDATKQWWSSPQGLRFLKGAMGTLSTGRYRLQVTPTKGLFRPHEPASLKWSLDPDREQESDELRLECHLVLTDGETRAAPPPQIRGPFPASGPLSGTFEFDSLPPGLWKAEVRLIQGRQFEVLAVTGFYCLGDQAVASVLSAAPRLKVDPQVSPDMLSHEGRPFPLHGVNYHVTDTYRDCFVRYNAWQNDLDLKVLADDGYNVLRTGNWQSFEHFFAEDGSLREAVLANLEAFFLTAARHGFQVQFVLGAFVMNPWNRDQCPIHNPNQRAKTVAAFTSFARRFGNWPHVQIDALNEPSYSVNGAWQLAKPSEDPHELDHWRLWLAQRYEGRLEDLWNAWGVAPNEVTSFETATLPTNHRRYTRNYDRQDTVVDGRLTDWYDFARETYSGWMGELREAVRALAPDSLFMLGRDESLRVPAQQDEAAAGHIDLINFHQWHRDSTIFSEYAFNRVRGLPCCGQEMGTYPYGDPRNDPRLTESHRARILERKLAYSFGNWLQWQAWNDPYMLDSIERALGLYRADGTSSPLARAAAGLARFEQAQRDRMRGLDENTRRVLIVFPTSSYFSPDSEAVFRTMVRTVRVWAERMRLGFDVVLEHLLDVPQQTGDPLLVVVPSVLRLSDLAWKRLTAWAREGKTVLVSGNIGRDEQGRPVDRWTPLGVSVETQPLAGVETLRLGAQSIETSYRRSLDHYEPATLYDRLVFGDSQGSLEAKDFPVGKGRLLFCPVPIEACDDDEVVEAVYRWALTLCAPLPVLFDLVQDPGPRVLIEAQAYRDATRYTLVNEGARSELALTDRRTGRRFSVVVEAGGASWFWALAQGEAPCHPTDAVRSLA